MQGIIDMTKGQEATLLEELFAGEGPRAPRRQRQGPEGGGKIGEVLPIGEAAEGSGGSRHRIDAAINGGELAFYQIGERARKIKISDLHRWLEAKRTRIGGAEIDD